MQAASAQDDDGVLILQAVRQPATGGGGLDFGSNGFGGGGGRSASGIGGGGGRSRRSHSVTAESARIPGVRWLSQLKQPPSTAAVVDSAIPEETGAAGSPWSPASARSPRPQQPQRRRASLVSVPAVHREIAPPATAVEQMLRAVQSVEVLESQDEWTLVTRQSGATLWLSKRTGQFKPHAPNSVYQTQALELKKMRERINQLEAELSSTQVRLGKLKAEQMQMTSENLRPDLEEKDAQIMRLNHSLEKVKSELCQRDELVKLKEAELTRRSKEIQKLSEKVQRVDALMSELLDAQERKNQLEQQLREKDFELVQTQRQLQIAGAEKSEAVAAERTTRLRCENLMEQVRIEVEHTAALEERADGLEKASEARVRLEAEVERLIGAATDAEALAASSRRIQRQLSDQLAAARAELQQLRAEREAVTAAADAREAEARRELAEALAVGDRHRRAAVGLRSLLAELRRQIPGSGAWIDAYFASAGGGGGGGGGGRGHGGRLLNGRLSSAAPQMQLVRRASPAEASGDDPRVLEAYDKANDALRANAAAGRAEETPRSKNSRTTGSPAEVSSTNGRVGSCASRQLRDRVAALYIHLGDRVTVRLASGRTAEAVVKYIGAPADSGGRGWRGARYGLRLLGKSAAQAADSPVAAADDVVEAANYRSDLLAPAKRIESVFNLKANAFRQLDELVNDHLRMSQQRQ